VFRRAIPIPQTFHIVFVKRKEFHGDPRVLDEEYIFALLPGQSIKDSCLSAETERGRAALSSRTPVNSGILDPWGTYPGPHVPQWAHSGLP